MCKPKYHSILLRVQLAKDVTRTRIDHGEGGLHLQKMFRKQTLPPSLVKNRLLKFLRNLASSELTRQRHLHIAPALLRITTTTGSKVEPVLWQVLNPPHPWAMMEKSFWWNMLSLVSPACHLVGTRTPWCRQHWVWPPGQTKRFYRGGP